jgi:hypothetical protein
MTLSATAGEKPARPKQIHPARRINGFFAIIRNNLRQSKFLGDKKTREACEGEDFPPLSFSRTFPLSSLFLVFGGKLKHFFGER